MKIKILGAGSIGNHLAQASRRMGWGVVVVDNDPKALERMKNEIYPKRYGAWDETIQLFVSDQEPKGGFDIIMIGTPPDTHLKLALAAIDEEPKLLHIEKPLCAPDLAGVGEFIKAMEKHPRVMVTVGYDHVVSEAIEAVTDLVKRGLFGDILTIDVEFREHWRGFFAAHSWLSGPQDSYLGFWKRGGGAGGEHSHALHLWQYFANVLDWGPIVRAEAMFDMRNEKGALHDQLAIFNLETKKRKIGRVVQDVITYPVRKWARLQGERGFIEWHYNGVPEGDLIRYQTKEETPVEKIFPKKRPDDFYREVLHYDKLLSGEIPHENSPLSFERGVEIMKILNKAYFQNSI